MNFKENSPFTPGSPVPIELFVGRSNQVKEILQYINQTIYGKQENVYLEGERGIGKSSLASFIRSLANSQYEILGIHVFLGTINNLDEMVRRIFEELLKQTQVQSWFSKIKDLFGQYIKQIGLFGISVSFSPPADELKRLVISFPEALSKIIEKIIEDKKGLLIILDDISELSMKSEFANWYKSFVDQVATHYQKYPVFIMLIGLPENRDSLSKLQPSLMRVFRVVEIEKLSDTEVENFLSSAFLKVNIEVKPDAMEQMVKFSSGLPILMHEIGDATFLKDQDKIIDLDDAIDGILEAGERIGKKYLDPKVYRAIRSERYISILRKCAEVPFLRSFTKQDVEARLTENGKQVFHNFLRKLRELEIIEPDLDKGRGSYRFVNEIYPVYIWMEAQKFKYRTKYKQNTI